MMKKITLLFLMSFLSFCGYAQLAPECFEDPWTPVPAATGTSAQWLTLDNSIGTAFTWVQEPHSATLPSYEGTAGTHSAYIDKENVPVGTFAEDFLVTPEFTMPVGGVLTFQSKLTTAGVQGSVYRVYVLPAGADETDPAAYVEIQEWTESQLAVSPILVWEQKTLTFGTTYDGQTVRLAFSMTGDNFDRWQIDCVSVTEPCDEVENLTAENIGLDSAELSWDNPGGATSFEIEIVLEGSTPTGNGIIYSGALPYVATSTASGDPLVQTPFLANTGYKYYVRAICDDGGTSDIVGAYFFQTVGLGDSCAAPLEITALPFSDTDNTANYADEYNGMPGSSCGNMSWEDYLGGNDVVYSFTADFTGVVSVELTGNDAYSGLFIYNECTNIGGACIGGGVGGWQGNDVIVPEFNVVEGEDYYFVISTYINQTTNYTLTIQQVFCDEPVGLTPTNIGMTSADLNWTNPSGATSWQIYVQDPGDGIPAGAGTTVSSNSNVTVTEEFDGSDLTSATPYEYYVRAACGDGNFSAWAGPYPFNTMICEADDQCTFTFTMWDSFGDGWNGNTMTVSQNGIALGNISLASGSGPQEVTFQVCHGLPIQLYWNSGGSWAAEVGVSIQNGFDQTIFTKNPGTGSQNTLLYEADVDCDNPLCLPPTGLDVANIGMTTVDLSWDGLPAGNWEYYITEEGNPAPTAANDGTPTTTNPTLGATFLEGGTETLAASTNYEYYVRMICDGASTDESEWSQPFAFATASCEVADQCEYTFVMNSNWWAGWMGGTMTISQNGAAVAVIGSTFTTGQTQSVTVPLCDDVPFEVEWTSGGGFSGQMGLVIINSFDQTLFTLPFNSGGSVGTVIFEADNDCDNPACIAPTGLYAQNGTMSTIELGWDGPATGNWEYYIVEEGDPAPDGSTPGISATTNPVTATLAEPGTNYEFYVRLVCEGAATDYSPVAGPVAFHSELCNEEDKCTFTFEMLSNNGWGGEQNTFTIYQGGVPVGQFPNQANIWWWGTSYTEEIQLCHNEEIEVVWNVQGWTPNDKGLVIYSPFLEDIYTMDFGSQVQGDTVFTGVVSCDPPPCPKPQNLEVTDIQLTQVTFNWEEMGAATEWAVWVVPMGAEDPLPDSVPTFTTTSNPVVYGDDASEVLVAGTPYQFYVMAMCGEEDGNSTIAGQEVFVTAIANDDCEGAVDVPVNAGIECDEIVSGTLTGATSAGIQPSCMWGMPVADVWYSFVATSENQAISISNQTGGIYPYMTIFEGDCDGGLTELYCGYNNPVTYNEFTVGNTYYIMVYVDWFNDPTAVTSFDLCIRTPEPPISVSDTLYTIEELVQEVLLGSECAVISNVTSSTGTDYSSSSGIGYFNQNGSSFPFEDGMILATGDIQEAPAGSTFFGNDNYTWIGDADLLEILNDGGFFGQTHNASIVEFDFVPLADNISFNFLFASDEWGIYQCNFSDAFAFILTGASIDDNLAVIPGTEIPVSVTSIRDDAYNANCGDANVEFFGQYNGNDPIAANISYNGQTVVMQASAPVVPGETYHIKLVVADWNDTSVNSAVFIEGGSFDVGEVDLGLDMTQENDNAVCNDGQALLDTELDEETYDFIWYANDVVIDGETDPTLVVNQDDFDFESGPITFMVEAYFAGSNCAKVGDILVEFYNDVEVDAGDASDLYICDASGFASFNLEENTELVLSGDGITDPADYTVTYHASQEDAESGDNDLASPFTNTVAGGQTIYVRIQHVAGCLGYKQFQITVGQSEAVIDLTNDFTLCEGTSGTVTATVTNVTGDVTYTWTKDGEPFAGTTNSIEVTEAGIYEVTIAENGCTKSAEMTVEVNEVPVVEPIGDVYACEPYELPALAVGNYFTGENGTGTQLAAGSLIETNQTVYVYAANGECTDQTSFTVTISGAVIDLTDDFTLCEGDSGTVTATVTNAGDVTYSWTKDGEPFEGTTSSIEVTETGVYEVTVDENGCTKSASMTATFNEVPVIAPVGDVSECEAYELPALAVGNYFTGENGTGTPLAAGSMITTSQVVYIYAANGECTAEESFAVAISSPVFNLGGPYVYCDATDATVSVNPENFTAGEATYAWTVNNVASAETGSSIDASEFGTYEVTVTVNGCSTTHSVEVTESTIVVMATVTDECVDGVYTLEVTDVDGSFDPATASYAWTGPNGFVSSSQTFSAVESGTGMYNVTVTTADGCVGTASFEVVATQCLIQRGISPNGDGENDSFDLSNLDVHQLSIFNRYGQEVYSRTNYSNEWFGQSDSGDELPTGTYFYMIERNNGEQITGWIYINREE